MIGKKINQLATELAPVSTDLTIIGDPISGVSKKITLAQLGAIFSGAVSFYTNLAGFPATGDINVIYCAKDTQKLYLWSGSAYTEVFPSQALLDTYQLRSEKGNANGYASLDSQGKVPISQLPSSIMEYKGTWNASTNTPTLANGTGDTGDVYICNVAGTVNFGAGPITFAVGDYVIYSGTIWQRSSGAVGTVTSVAITESGDALTITGSPITTSGTINIGFAGTGTQYIKGDGTLATFPSIISQAQNLVTEVYNSTGATLTKGTVVYINGGQGNLPTVTKALASGDSTSAQTYGIVQADITNMNNGYVVVAGRLSDIDTQAYANGTQLYLSSTTAGAYTSTKQYAPAHLVYVGIIVRSHPTQGVIEVKIQNGYELDELHNVAAQSPSNGDILQYVSSTSLWTKVAGTTSNIAEGSNLYYTDARSRAALSFTAGSGAYNSTTGVITIPTNTNQLTNGANYITLASLSAGAGISYNNTTGVIASTITQYTDANARAAISETVTGLDYNNTTGVLSLTSGYVIPTTTNESNWNAAYNDKINSASVTGTTTKTLTLTQQDGGTITASWTDDNTDAVTSVFGRTGAVVAASGDYNTSQVTESGNLYFTNARAIASTLTGYTSGAGTITSSDSILSAIQKLNGNIGALTTGVSSVNGLTGAVTLTTSNIVEGTNLYYTEARVSANTDVAANTAARHNAVTIGTANGLSLSTQVLSLGLASTSTTGALSSTDWNTFNNKTSNTGTVTSVGLSSATSGVTIGSTPITTSGTITLAIATASGSQQGLLSSTDWTTFNNKQNALTNPVTGTGTTNYLPKFTGTSTIGNSIVSESGGALNINGSVTMNGSMTIQSSGVTRGFFGDVDGDNNIQLRSQSAITFKTGGNNLRATLDASGNLGLGVTPSDWFVVYKALQIGSYGAAISGQTNDQALTLWNNAYPNASNVDTYTTTNAANKFRMEGGSFKWFSAGSGTAGNAISFTQAMTLNASGNLSIGNTNDTYKLDVTGTGRFSGNVLISKSNDATVEVNSTTSASYSAFFHSESGVAKAYWEYLNSTFSDSTRRNYLEAYNSVGGFSVYTAGTKRLDIASTGAATFSDEVRAGSWVATANSRGFTIRNAANTAYRTAVQMNSSNVLIFGQDTDISALTLGVGSEQMRITSSGNVGIGTSSPNVYSGFTNLQVNNSSGNGLVQVTGSSATVGSFYAGGGQGQIGTSSSHPFVLFTADVERMRITSGGNVGIGTTSPSGKLHVAGDGDAANLIRLQYTGTGSNGFFDLSVNSTEARLVANYSTTAIPMIFLTGATERMRITSGGNIEIATGSIKTGEPDTGWGRAAIKIGASVSGAAFNVTRYLPVSVDGTVYYINLNSSTP